MKNIKLNENFQLEGFVWAFSEKEGKIVLNKLHKAGKLRTFTPPTLQEVREFFKLKGYTEEAAIKFHDYYAAGDWKDKKGNLVKVWKQKALSVWFRDEYKIKNEQPEESDANKFLF